VHVDQRLALRRQLAEAVDDFFEQAVDLVGGLVADISYRNDRDYFGFSVRSN
jgi:hypothetical protein